MSIILSIYNTFSNPIIYNNRNPTNAATGRNTPQNLDAGVNPSRFENLIPKHMLQRLAKKKIIIAPVTVLSGFPDTAVYIPAARTTRAAAPIAAHIMDFTDTLPFSLLFLRFS
jgi:hypothetical protein